MKVNNDTAQFLKLLQVFKESEKEVYMIQVTKGKVETAKKVVIYGPEGIGKSTLASNFPNPVFIDTEGSTKALDVARYPEVKNWMDIKAFVEDSINTRQFSTIVIDTADWAERFCIRAVCAKQKVSGIEDIPYGKGYTYVMEEFAQLLDMCNKAIAAGINVVFTAHAQMRKFEQPDEMGSYDRWEMKLSKKAAPLLKEWADMVLFCNYKTQVMTDSKTQSKKAFGGKRVMYTSHHPCWDAKNRYDLPEQVDMEFAQIAHLFSTQPTPVQAQEPNYRLELRALIAEKSLDGRRIAATWHLGKDSTNEDYRKAYEDTKKTYGGK